MRKPPGRCQISTILSTSFDGISLTRGDALPAFRAQYVDFALFETARKSITTMNVRIKRVYEKPDENDGTRILVDRLWPRGLTKEKARVDFWLKDVAPSTELRKWFAHDPAKWTEFESRYREELQENKEQLSRLEQEAAKGTVTLVYGARDQQHNEAIVLQRLLKAR